MRAPPDADEVDTDEDSGSDGADTSQGDVPGAFPGSLSTASNDNSYY